MRPLRDRTPGKIHLLTCRTRSSELLLVPSSCLNNLVGGIIAKYSNMHGIDIYSVSVLSNHYHILAKGKDISLFEENINREIAKRVNKLLSRKGSLWARRYDDQITVKELDALEGLLYVITNPVKHGLVTHPKHWPGLNTYKQTLGAKAKEYTFFNFTEYNKARNKAKLTGEVVNRSDYETKYKLEIQKLKDHNLKEYNLEKLIEQRVRKLQREIRAEGKGFLGRKAILNQKPRGEFPKKTSKSNRPICYTKCLKALANFKEELKIKLAQYKEASIRYRLGLPDFEFPPYCFYPPRHHMPKNHAFIHS